MKTKMTLKIVFVTLLLIVMNGCDYIYSDPELSLPENAENKIAQIVNMMDDNGQFSGAVLISVKGKIIYKDAV
ncbi:MAG: hypothetical protein K8R74_14420, partial [Bacteroidales bacterium]|nr:hypothetical protein [Bacteroidales bacterium]